MKKLSKKWKIFLTALVVLVGGLYGVYKINNRNAFEEMYNSYYNFVPISALYNMPQIEPMPRDEIGLDIAELYYKDTKNDVKIEFSLISFNNEKKIILTGSTFVGKGVYLDINYVYDMNTHKLENSVTFRGENVPLTNDKPKQRKNY